MADTRHKVMLAVPGPNLKWGSVLGITSANTGRHDVKAVNSDRLFIDAFNLVWIAALNAAEAGDITHFAMLHADITPQKPWLDLLLEDLDRLDADLISAVSPIKDTRGVTSSGLGDPKDPWHPFRRFTLRELAAMPDVFNAADFGCPDKPLLHNTGCWVCDLRKPVFFQTDVYGRLRAYFEYPHQVTRNAEGKWILDWESEDWFFSRQLHDIGANTYVSRRVKLAHRGEYDFLNDPPWGKYQEDEDTRHKWGEPQKAEVA